MPNTPEFKAMCEQFKSGDGAECPVCLLSVKDDNLTMRGVADVVYNFETLCPHSFCEACVDGLSGQASRSCPMCREDISMLIGGVERTIEEYNGGDDDIDDGEVPDNILEDYEADPHEMSVYVTFFAPSEDADRFDELNLGRINTNSVLDIPSLLREYKSSTDDHQSKIKLSQFRYLMLSGGRITQRDINIYVDGVHMHDDVENIIQRITNYRNSHEGRMPFRVSY